MSWVSGVTSAFNQVTTYVAATAEKVKNLKKKDITDAAAKVSETAVGIFSQVQNTCVEVWSVFAIEEGNGQELVEEQKEGSEDWVEVGQPGLRRRKNEKK